MYYYDEKGNRHNSSVKGESQKSPKETFSIEHYGSEKDGKSKKWIWIVLAILAVILLIYFILMYIRSNRKSSVRQSFGFRFY